MINICFGYKKNKISAQTIGLISENVKEIVSEILFESPVEINLNCEEFKKGENLSDIEVCILADPEDIPLPADVLAAWLAEVGKRIRVVLNGYSKNASGFMWLKLKQPVAFGAF